MLRFAKINGNPFGKNLPDCGIRSTSLALNMSYEYICKRLGLKFIDNYGLRSQNGIDPDVIYKKLHTYFDNYETDACYGEVDDIYLDDTLASNIIEWHDLYSNCGQFCLDVRPKIKPELNDWHLTYIDTDKHVLYDTFDCRQMLVYGFLHVRPEKKLQNSDPNSRFQSLVKIYGPEKLEKYKNIRL